MIGVGTTIFLVRPQTFGSTPFTNEKSLLFDGVDEYVDCGSLSVLDSVANLSVSFWAKTSQVNPNGDRLFGAQVSTSNLFGCSIVGNGDNLYFFAENGTTVYAQTSSGSALPPDNTWRHYAFVYDGGGATNADKVKVYVNGSAETMSFGAGTIASTMASNLSSANWKIGGRDATAYYDGNIDEFAVFDYSLNGTQVTSLYNSGTPTDLDNTSGVTAPVHWWRMGDGDTFSTITDVGTTGGNNATMTNMEAGDIVTDTP